jgi:hypothetical protein
LTLILGAVSWVLETDEGDKLPNGESGPAKKLWVARNATEWERVSWREIGRSYAKRGTVDLKGRSRASGQVLQLC